MARVVNVIPQREDLTKRLCARRCQVLLLLPLLGRGRGDANGTAGVVPCKGVCDAFGAAVHLLRDRHRQRVTQGQRGRRARRRRGHAERRPLRLVHRRG